MAQSKAQRVLARWWCLPFLGAGIAVMVSLASTRQAGFPLDDSWIHQDFARTLATTGHFAYLPGRSGAGSTSPLWVLLLVPPYWLGHAAPPLSLVVGWSAILGGLSLAGIGVAAGWVAYDLVGRTSSDQKVQFTAAIIASLACIAEWHLDWAAMSGMETALFAFLVLLLFLTAGRNAHPVMLGLLSALALSVRPEGAFAGLIVVIGSAWSALPARSKSGRSTGKISWRGAGAAARNLVQRIVNERLWEWTYRWLVPFMIAALIGSIPYILINVTASGHILPSTLYAKSTIYGVQDYLYAAASDVSGAALTLVGSSPVVLLLWALSYSNWLLRRVRQRQRVTTRGSTADPSRAGVEVRPGRDLHEHSGALRAMLWLWVVSLVLGYAGRGVENLVHGRYLMPVIPELIALGAAGAASLILAQRHRLVGTVGTLLLACSAAFSLVRGAQQVSANVGFINATQVATALWLRSHTPTDTLVATHDIGAIGYFTHDRVVDIAGLADPELISLINDQPALEAYLRSHHVAYVVMYTDWFGPPSTLVHDLSRQMVYRAPGSNTFVVYQTNW